MKTLLQNAIIDKDYVEIADLIDQDDLEIDADENRLRVYSIDHDFSLSYIYSHVDEDRGWIKECHKKGRTYPLHHTEVYDLLRNI